MDLPVVQDDRHNPHCHLRTSFHSPCERTSSPWWSWFDVKGRIFERLTKIFVNKATSGGEGGSRQKEAPMSASFSSQASHHHFNCHHVNLYTSSTACLPNNAVHTCQLWALHQRKACTIHRLGQKAF